MGSSFLATGLGAGISGILYTTIYGRVEKAGHPEYVWYVLAFHVVLGAAVIYLFTRLAGQFEERKE